jgi:hypothetical protein
MKIQYSILWFDDDIEATESLNTDPLKEEIKSWGFESNIVFVNSPKEFLDRMPFKEFDLIVVDQNIEGTSGGQEFISRIRENAIYTEVVFYSAREASDLWEAVRDNKLEGVFVSSRRDIIAKIIRVGKQSISKVLDLENMRGIVMAEVGELDQLLEDIIKVGLVELSAEEKKEIYTKFSENASLDKKEWLTRLEEFTMNPDVEQMLRFCDSDKRWQNFNRLKVKHQKLIPLPKLGNYSSEILKPRNFLAHGRPEKQEDGSFIFHYNGEVYPFTDETSIGLRNMIIRYKKSFSEILHTLKS